MTKDKQEKTKDPQEKQGQYNLRQRRQKEPKREPSNTIKHNSGTQSPTLPIRSHYQPKIQTFPPTSRTEVRQRIEARRKLSEMMMRGEVRDERGKDCL
jgi:hypothetical protein